MLLGDNGNRLHTIIKKQNSYFKRMLVANNKLNSQFNEINLCSKILCSARLLTKNIMYVFY